MAIEIKIEKVVVQGVRKIKVLEVKALGREELPVEYLIKKGAVRKGRYNQDLYINPLGIDDVTKPLNWEKLLDEGDTYSKDEFEKAVVKIKKAGEELKRINSRLREENKNWKGESTVII